LRGYSNSFISKENVQEFFLSSLKLKINLVITIGNTH
jgi:hypothetical protein